MLIIKEWTDDFKKTMLQGFSNRIVFIGLQGSYARGEETENSDIDVVVIFNDLTMDDLKKYDKLISEMPCRDKICGFISGKEELKNWEKSDLFQFYNDTVALYGSLDFIKPLIKKENVEQAVLIGACNIYHACCHNIVHEKSAEILKALYKQAVFVLQAKYFLATGKYIKKKKDLLEKLSSQDKKILEIYFLIKSNEDEQIDEKNFENYSDALFTWSGQIIKNEYTEQTN